MSMSIVIKRDEGAAYLLTRSRSLWASTEDAVMLTGVARPREDRYFQAICPHSSGPGDISALVALSRKNNSFGSYLTTMRRRPGLMGSAVWWMNN
jgi:hypothetical protein